MNYLISAANGAQVNLDQISVGEVAENTFVKGTSILPVNLQVSGSYRQVRTFLINLENLNRLNHISGITLTKSEAGIMNLNVTIEGYSWTTGDTALNDPQTVPKSSLPGKPDPYESVSVSVYSN